MNMLIFLCKYKICSIFLLVTLCAIAPSAAQSVCEKLANVTQSTPFSFQKHVMKLRGFTFYPLNEIMFMFYDDFFQVSNKDKIQADPEEIDVTLTYFKNTFSYQEWHYLMSNFWDTFSSGEEFDSIYFLYKTEITILSAYLVFATSNKQSIAYSDIFFNWIFTHDTYIKLITTENCDRYMNVYAVGVDPVAKKGLIIYKFWYSMGGFFTFTFSYEMIRNAGDLETEKYFYLQLTPNPNEVRFVHPKKGNVTAAKLYPLAQQAMPGYIVSKKLLLFDVDLGCVHIIENYAEFDLNEQFDQDIDFILVRQNIPYEDFFICEDKYDIPNKFSFLSPDRCDKTISNPDGQVQAGRSDTGGRNVGENDNTTDDNVIVWTGSNKEFSNKTISSIIAILVVICSVVLCSFLIWRHKKKNKNSKNQSNVEKARSKKATSVDKKGGAGGDLKVSSKSKSKIKQRSQQSSGGGVSSKKSAKSSKSSTSTPVTTSSAGGVPAKSHSSSTGIGKQPSTKK